MTLRDYDNPFVRFISSNILLCDINFWIKYKILKNMYHSLLVKKQITSYLVVADEIFDVIDQATMLLKLTFNNQNLKL